MAYATLLLSAREIGACTRKARKQAGLTQVGAVGLYGVNVQFFNDWPLGCGLRCSPIFEDLG